MGIETIPNETTPFHIDRGMATQFTSYVPSWLLFVGSRAHVPSLYRRYRASDARHGEQQQKGQVAAVDAVEKRGAEELERRQVLQPQRQLEDGGELRVEVAGESEGPQQPDRRSRVP